MKSSSSAVPAPRGSEARCFCALPSAACLRFLEIVFDAAVGKKSLSAMSRGKLEGVGTLVGTLRLGARFTFAGTGVVRFFSSVSWSAMKSSSAIFSGGMGVGNGNRRGGAKRGNVGGGDGGGVGAEVAAEAPVKLPINVLNSDKIALA